MSCGPTRAGDCGDLGQVLEGSGEFLWTWMEPALEMGSGIWLNPLAASASWNAQNLTDVALWPKTYTVQSRTTTVSYTLVQTLPNTKN